MKRVLIISYYWPPAGGGGVQRWLKMSKYLPENGWQPIIYTPSNAEVSGMDDSLVKEIHPATEIIKSPIWEPYDLYKKVLGIKKEEKIYSGFIQKENKRPSWVKKMTQWIRGNFFIPDARRFWISPGVKYLDKYLQEHKVDAIISTGPPHTTHMIAMKIAKIHNLPWIADFRDPWTEIDFYKDLHLTWIADRIHKRLEKKVLTKATQVVTISPTLVKDMIRISGRQDIKLITNGYDSADFSDTVKMRTDKLVMAHIGSMNADRNPQALWQALSNIAKLDPSFANQLEIKLLGPVDSSIFASIADIGMKDNVNHQAFVPHDVAIREMKESQLLLLSINNTGNQAGILPGKMFEYLGTGNQILCIGPQEGDAVELITSCFDDAIAEFNDVEAIQRIISQAYQNFKSGTPYSKNNEVTRYSRQTLAKQYCELLSSLT